MNKSEVRDLFSDQLNELQEFEIEIKKVKKLINLIVDNFDLVKEDITDDQIGDVSSTISIKSTKLNSIIKDILSDSKKLESFINEVKLLKRKRDIKLKKEEIENFDATGSFNSFKTMLAKLKQKEIERQKFKF